MADTKPTSIRDVAKLAGVSTATVSHVVNNTRTVSEPTRARVQRAIKALNYAPNAMARNLRTGRTGKILFIVPDIGSVFFASIIEALENSVSRYDYQLMIANTHENWEREREYLKTLNRSNIDGLILATAAPSQEALDEYLPKDVPALLVDRKRADRKMNGVYIATYECIYDSVIELAQQGHQKIGFISGIENVSTSVERLKAYQEGIKKMHLQEFIAYGNSLPSSSPACLQKLVKQGCTAIVIANETMTDDALIYLYAKHPSLARKITICGFRHETAAYGLTDLAIVQPSSEMGKKAGERIVDMILNNDNRIREIHLRAYRVKD